MSAPFLRYLRPAWIAQRVKKTLTPRHRLQKIGTLQGYDFVHLGSSYGGWTFVNHPSLKGSVIISAGVGEDVSFDVAFARRFDARVILVDPTPRAIAHYESLAKRFGKPSSCPYEQRSGNQPVEAYDLSGLGQDQLSLVPMALWNDEASLRFFLPPDSQSVSCSIVNYQSDYRQDTDHIVVDAVPLDQLLGQFGIAINELALLKLDIEGAEIEVLKDLLAKGITPLQILVEFDELGAPSRRARQRVESVESALTEHGYKCVHTDGQTDFLFVLESAFAPS